MARDHICGDFVVVEVKDCFRCDLRHRLGWVGLAAIGIGWGGSA